MGGVYGWGLWVSAAMTEIMWELTGAAKRRTRMAEFIDVLRAAGVRTIPEADHPDAFPALHRWSIAHTDEFWAAVSRYCGIVGTERSGSAWDQVVVGGERMAPPDQVAGPRWFPGARLNFAENLLRTDDDSVAIVSWTEAGPGSRLTHAELRQSVASCAAALRAVGVSQGDRVAAVVPNIPESIIAMLATTSLGALWSSCSPDFGAAAVLDRLGQIAPRVLFAADGYRYAGKRVDVRSRIAEVASRLPTLEQVVLVPHLDDQPDLGGMPLATGWRDFVAGHAGAAPQYLRLPFDHPAYILYSSGTTGLPKCIVHGAGGTLLQIMKEHLLHVDLRRTDRLFYATTCGWMMWNWLANALATGASIVLYEGAPLPPSRPSVLWDMAAAEGVTVFGTSAKYLALADKAGLAPGRTHDLSSLRAVLSTGSPLAPHSFDYVHRDVSPRVQLSSCSGGTDIVSCFALGNPLSPVRRGELQGLGLGMSVEVYDDTGHPLVDQPGELVCTRPFPSMPIAFWNDPAGSAYRAAYFDRFPGVWRQGDWARVTVAGGVVIYGRSDTTLNPGGVRIGTAEIYRQVEQLPEVLECVAVSYDAAAVAAPARPAERGPTVAASTDAEVVLFVRLAEGVGLDDALRARLRDVIRRNTSAHHVPRRIRQVTDIPRTISGKIAEKAVGDALHGRRVINADALANPTALDEYRALAGALDW